jgi:hypothetical protein
MKMFKFFQKPKPLKTYHGAKLDMIAIKVIKHLNGQGIPIQNGGPVRLRDIGLPYRVSVGIYHGHLNDRMIWVHYYVELTSGERREHSFNIPYDDYREYYERL